MNKMPPTDGPRSKKMFDLPEVEDATKRRAARILKTLRQRYPDAHCELNAENPHELLVATILSAQATDVGVNKATPGLFERFPTPADYAAMTPADIEPYVKTVNFWRNKAKSVEIKRRASVSTNSKISQSMVFRKCPTAIQIVPSTYAHMPQPTSMQPTATLMVRSEAAPVTYLTRPQTCTTWKRSSRVREI